MNNELKIIELIQEVAQTSKNNDNDIVELVKRVIQTIDLLTERVNILQAHIYRTEEKK